MIVTAVVTVSGSDMAAQDNADGVTSTNAQDESVPLTFRERRDERDEYEFDKLEGERCCP